MRLSVTLTLVTLLFLATMLTFFLVSTFWLRESALAFAREQELVLTLAVRTIDRLPETDRQEAFFAAVLSAGPGESGALAACLKEAAGTISCRGAGEPDRQDLAKTLAESNPAGGMRTLSGLTWILGVPAKKYLDVGIPVDSTGQPITAAAVRHSLEAHFGPLRTMQRTLVGYLGLNLIILTVIGFFRFRTRLFRPMDHLVRLADSYSDESGVPFLAMHGGNELAQLTGSMQQMLARIKADRQKLQQHVASLQEANRQLIATREEMVRAEKLASVGRLAAGLAHEIGNPVGIVQGYLGLMGQLDVAEEERREFCRRAEQELLRISQLVRRLQDLSRPVSGDQEEVDVHLVLDEVVSLLRPQPLMDGIDLRLSLLAEESLVRGNADQLLQVLLNCLINAADAMRAGGLADRGVIEISTDSVVDDSCRSIRVAISDTGPGLAEEALANAFDPFFTTKEPGKGTGLGLSVSYALIKGMGGRISLANREGGGAVVSIELPIVQF